VPCRAHLGIVVPDLARARSAIEQRRLAVTPTSASPSGRGQMMTDGPAVTRSDAGARLRRLGTVRFGTQDPPPSKPSTNTLQSHVYLQRALLYHLRPRHKANNGQLSSSALRVVSGSGVRRSNKCASNDPRDVIM